MARRWLIVLTLALLVAGCGGSGHATTTRTTSATHTTSASSTTSTTSASNPAFSYLPGALVTMRQYSPQSLLWQTVSVQSDGHVLLTTIIGEIAGAERRRLTLPVSQTTRLRRLVAAARRVAPPAPSDPHAELYTLTLPGRPAESLQGKTPPALTALVNYLSGLMFAYCC